MSYGSSTSEPILRVIGCSAGSPHAEGAASGYVLQVGALSLLIDCGPGVMRELTLTNSVESLSAVLISHQHYDHCGDLTALAFYRAFPDTPGNRPLPMFAPAELSDTLKGMDELFGVKTIECLATPLADQFDFHGIPMNGLLSVGGLKVETLNALHPVPTVSVRFPEVGLAYTADTGLHPDLVDFCRGQVILGEATYPSSAGRDLTTHGHMSGDELGALAESAEAAMLIVTHMSEPDRSAETVAAVRRRYRGPVMVARPGLCVPIPTASSAAGR